jgi:hypothetical protein
LKSDLEGAKFRFGLEGLKCATRTDDALLLDKNILMSAALGRLNALIPMQRRQAVAH